MGFIGFSSVDRASSPGLKIALFTTIFHFVRQPFWRVAVIVQINLHMLIPLFLYSVEIKPSDLFGISYKKIKPHPPITPHLHKPFHQKDH